MAYSFEQWKKEDDKRRRTSSRVSAPIFSEFKRNFELNNPVQSTERKPWKTMSEIKRERGDFADAERFSGRYQDEAEHPNKYNRDKPKSQKAKDADADRFAGRYTDEVEDPGKYSRGKTQKAKDADADRFAGRYMDEAANPDSYKPTAPVQRTERDSKVEGKKSLLARVFENAKTQLDKPNFHERQLEREHQGESDMFKGFFKADNENDTYSEKAGAGFRLGIGKTLESAGDGVNYALSHQFLGSTKFIGNTIKKAGEMVSEGFEDEQQDFELSDWKNPDYLASAIPQAIPQLALSIIPGLGTAAWASRIQKLQKLPKLARILIGNGVGTGVQSTLDATLEAGGVYEESLRRGMSEEEAKAAGDDTFWKNLALGVGTNFAELALMRSGLGKTFGSLSKGAQIGLRTAGGAVTEGLQEGAQEGISASALGDDFSWTDPSTVEAMFLGAILGGGVTAGVSGFKEVKDSMSKRPVIDSPSSEVIERAANELPPEIRAEFDEAVSQLEGQDIPRSEALEIVAEQLLDRTPAFGDILAAKQKEYIASKKLEQQSTNLNPVTEQEVAAKNEVEEALAPQPLEGESSSLLNMETNGELPNILPPSPQMDFDASLDVPSVPLAPPVMENNVIAPTDFETPIEAPAAPLDVQVGDTVNLKGTRPDTGYIVEAVEGEQVQVLTPNQTSIKVPKSRITNLLHREAQEAALEQELPQGETFGNTTLPPNFRADLRQGLNELVNEGMPINQAVEELKADDYYADTPEWQSLIDEEAKAFGYEQQTEQQMPQETVAFEQEMPKEVTTNEQQVNNKRTTNEQQVNNKRTTNEQQAPQEVAADFKVGDVVYAPGNAQVTIKKIDGNRAIVKTTKKLGKNETGIQHLDLKHLTKEPKERKKPAAEKSVPEKEVEISEEQQIKTLRTEIEGLTEKMLKLSHKTHRDERRSLQDEIDQKQVSIAKLISKNQNEPVKDVKLRKYPPQKEIVLYRTGREDGHWWSESKEYAQNGFTARRGFHEKTFSLNSILDATEGMTDVIEPLLDSETLKLLKDGNDSRNTKVRKGYVKALKENGYDALTYLDGDENENEHRTYFIVDPSQSKSVSPKQEEKPKEEIPVLYKKGDLLQNTKFEEEAGTYTGEFRRSRNLKGDRISLSYEVKTQFQGVEWWDSTSVRKIDKFPERKEKPKEKYVHTVLKKHNEDKPFPKVSYKELPSKINVKFIPLGEEKQITLSFNKPLERKEQYGGKNVYGNNLSLPENTTIEDINKMLNIEFWDGMNAKTFIVTLEHMNTHVSPKEEVKPLEKHVEEAMTFLEDAVNQYKSMKFIKEDKDALHFNGEYGFDNEIKEEVKIQKDDGMVYTRPLKGGDWVNSGVTYPAMGKATEKLSAKEEILSIRKKMREGDYTAKDLQEHFQFIKNNEEEVKEHFMELLNNSKNHKRKQMKTKEKLVNDLYDEALKRPIYGDKDSIVIRLDFGATPESDIAQYEKQVNAITDESIAKYLEKENAEKAENQKAIDNPQTIKEFIYKANSKGLSAEEQARLDELKALQSREQDKEKKTVALASVSKGDYTITADKHTKTGADIWVVKGPTVEKEAYAELARYMKSLGGYYSKYKKGFIFKEDPTDKLDGEINTEDAAVESGRRDSTRIAERLRTTAEKMQETIDDKRRDTRKTNTHKRAREDANAREEADAMERQQKIMMRIAEAIDSGEATFLDNVTARTHIATLGDIVRSVKRERLNLPENEKVYGDAARNEILRKPLTEEEINSMEMPKVKLYPGRIEDIIKALTGTKGLGRALARVGKELNAKKNQADNYLDGDLIRTEMLKIADVAMKNGQTKYYGELIKGQYDTIKRLEVMKLDTPSLLRSGIREYIRYTEDVGENTEQKEKDRKRKREAELSKMKISGFFPTPTKLIDRMLREANIKPGMSVLEPSAGKGNIAQRIREEHADAKLDVVEYDYDLHEYLESLDFNVVGKDFMEHTGEYDRIVMNPPFEKGQDIDHVRHAYEMLKPGGIVVAIMSEGPFFRSDKKATSFREWLEVGVNTGRTYKLDEGSFKDSERSTGVNTRLVIVKKPEIGEVEDEFAKKRRERVEREKELTAGFDQEAIAKAIKEKLDIDFPLEVSEEGIGKFNKRWSEEQMAQKRINQKTILSLMSDEDILNFAARGFGREEFPDPSDENLKKGYMEALKNSGNHNGFINYSSNWNKKNRVEIEAGDGRSFDPTLDSMWKRYLKVIERLPKKIPPTQEQKDRELRRFLGVETEGTKGEAFTENGTKIEFEYRVVEASDLIVSNDLNGKVNPNYPEELQPRDRSRKASQVQVQNIAQKLNPALVGESPKASDGAPIVGPDMVVESGNGRTMAIQKMYEELYSPWVEYNEFLSKNADKLGLDKTAIHEMEYPILVRVRTNEVDRKQFVSEANESNVSAMSASEQAAADAGKMNNKLMSLFTPGENGELNTSSNRAFITAFMGDVVAKSERGRYMTAEGALSQEGLSRVRNAVFAKAYGNNEAINILAESTDNNVRNITNAMLKSAPRFAIMKDKIANNALFNEDITTDIVDAMVKLAELRKEGINIQTFFDQTSMFDDISPEAKEMLSIFDDKAFKRSSKALSELFNQYVNVLEVAGSPEQIKLFQETPPNKAELLAAALKRVKVDENSEVQTSIFETESQNNDETGTTSSSKGSKQKVNKNEEGFSRSKEHPNVDGTETVDSAEYDKTVTRSQIVDFMQKHFQTTIGYGKTNGRLGFYKNRFAIIRTKNYGDMEVYAHEVGHRIDKRLGLSKIPKIREEFIRLAEWNLQIPEAMSGDTRAKEGVAEYFKQVFYGANLSSKSMKIKDLSPELRQAVADGLSAQKWHKPTMELKRMMESWLNGDGEQELSGIHSPIGEKRKGKRRTPMSTINEIYTRVWNKDHPFWIASRIVEKETGLKVEGKDNAHDLAALTRGTMGRAVSFIKRYTYDENGVVTGEGLEKILKKVDNIDNFDKYLIAKHALYLKTEKGKTETPITTEKIEEYLALASPEYEALAERLYAYQHRLLSVLVEGGLIDAKLPAELKEEYPYYVPFYRVMTEDGMRDGPNGNGMREGQFANNQNGLKRSNELGSSKNIISPIESIIKNTHLFFSLADHNSVGRALAQLANPDSPFATEAARTIIEAVPPDLKVTEIALDTIKKTLINAGLEQEMMDEIKMDMNQIAKIFNPVFRPNSAQNEVMVWEDGKPKMFKIRDDLLYNALVAQDSRQMNDIARYLLMPLEIANKSLRAGITMSPIFTVITFARSAMQLGIKTEAKNLNYFTQPFRVLKAMKSVATRDDALYDWWASGGGQSTFIATENQYLDRELEGLAMNRKAKNMLKYRKGMSNKDKRELAFYMAKVGVGFPFKMLNTFNDILDQSIKLGEYQVVMKQTKGNRIKAALASREGDLDYNRFGSTGMQFANKYSLFWNVALQGPDNLARYAVKNKVSFGLRGLLLVTLPTLILYWINRDDEEYQELTTFEKDMYWNIPKGDGTFWKIKIPFEAGILFKTIPEKLFGEFLDWKNIKGDDEQNWKDFRKNTTETMLVNFLPTLFDVAAEYMAGLDLETGRPTVPYADQSENKPDEFNEKTSEIAKAVGKFFNKSPIKLENAFLSLTGQMGQFYLYSTDVALDKAGVIDRPDTKGLIRNYWDRQKTTSVNDGTTNAVDTFYPAYQKLKQDHKDNGVKGRPSPLLSAFNHANDDMIALRKVKKGMLYNNLRQPDGSVFPFAERKRRIDIVNNALRDIARDVQGLDPLDPEGLKEAWNMAKGYEDFVKATDKAARDKFDAENK